MSGLLRFKLIAKGGAFLILGMVQAGFAQSPPAFTETTSVLSVLNVCTTEVSTSLIHTGSIQGVELSRVSGSTNQLESRIEGVLKLGIDTLLIEGEEGFRLKTLEEKDQPLRATISTKALRTTKAVLQQDEDFFQSKSMLDVSLTLEEKREQTLTEIEVELPRQNITLMHSTDEDENTQTTIQLKKPF